MKKIEKKNIMNKKKYLNNREKTSTLTDYFVANKATS